MGAHIAALLQSALDALGGASYALVFALVFAETGLLVPVPAETALVLASALAARGQLSIGAIVGGAALAACLGDFCAYSLGRGPGRRSLARRGRFLFLRASHVAIIARFFRRHGGKAVFLGRFVALLRIGAAFVAGMADMPLVPFIAWNVSGGVVWAATFGALGYFFGREWELIHRWLFAFGLVVVAGIAVAVVLRRRLAAHLLAPLDAPPLETPPVEPPPGD